MEWSASGCGFLTYILTVMVAICFWNIFNCCTAWCEFNFEWICDISNILQLVATNQFSDAHAHAYGTICLLTRCGSTQWLVLILRYEIGQHSIQRSDLNLLYKCNFGWRVLWMPWRRPCFWYWFSHCFDSCSRVLCTAVVTYMDITRTYCTSCY